MNINDHLNYEKVLRYFLLFLPPKGTKSILNVGCGINDVYGGMLKRRCREYVTVDIRKSVKVDYQLDCCDMKIFKDKRFEWGWCLDVIEHIPPDLKEEAVLEIMRVCQNCMFGYPLPSLHSDDPNVKIKSFYDDPGHTEVKIDWDKLFGETHNITDKTTKTGRVILIIKDKNYKEPEIKNLQKGLLDFN